jgi:hypothetical protein
MTAVSNGMHARQDNSRLRERLVVVGNGAETIRLTIVLRAVLAGDKLLSDSHA